MAGSAAVGSVMVVVVAMVFQEELVVVAGSAVVGSVVVGSMVMVAAPLHTPALVVVVVGSVVAVVVAMVFQKEQVAVMVVVGSAVVGSVVVMEYDTTHLAGHR